MKGISINTHKSTHRQLQSEFTGYLAVRRTQLACMRCTTMRA